MEDMLEELAGRYKDGEEDLLGEVRNVKYVEHFGAP